MNCFPKYLTTFLILVLMATTACEPGAEPDDSLVIASVGDRSLTLNQAFDSIPVAVLEQDTLSAVLNYKKQWIESSLTVKEAGRLNLEDDPEIQKRLERLKNQLLENALKQHILAEHKDELVITRDEAQNYFQAHKEKFVLDERYVRYRHVTTRTRAQAENARRDIMRGIRWDDVVKEYSLNPDLRLRESTQFWPISMAAADIPMLNRYLNVIGITEISPIYGFRGEFHFVQLMEERNEGDHPDFDWLIPQIKEWLRLEKSKRITNSFIRNLYLQAESNNEIMQASQEDILNQLSHY